MLLNSKIKMENKSTKKMQKPKINPVERKTNEEIETDENGNLFIGGKQDENNTKKSSDENFEGIED